MPAEYYDEDGFRLAFENEPDEEEKLYYVRAFPNVNKIAQRRVHCTSCNVHIGTAPVSEAIIRMHPVLRVTHCRSCHAFYNSGEFDKGEDGSELYCRWCGQGGEVYCCSKCPYVFCKSCIVRNLSRACVEDIVSNENWHCFSCAPRIMWHLRSQHWALENYIEKQKKAIKNQQLSPSAISLLMKKDNSTCCVGKGIHRYKRNYSLPATSTTTLPPATKRAVNKRPYSSTLPSEDTSVAEPVVSIPPLTHSILGELNMGDDALPGTSAAAAAAAHSKPSVPLNAMAKKQAGKQLPKQAGERKQPSPPTSGGPAAKKKRMGNNEVVCTPDIMSMFTAGEESTSSAAGTSQPARPSIVTVGARTPSTATSSTMVATPGVASPAGTVASGVPSPKNGTPKPKAILHQSMPRNLAVSVPANRNTGTDSEPMLQTVRVTATTPRQANTNTPVYHTIGGFRIDLHTASQQGTYRLPNGKLIQVRKQTSEAANHQPGGVPGDSSAEATQQVQFAISTPVQPVSVVPISTSLTQANRATSFNQTTATHVPPVIRNGTQEQAQQQLRRIQAQQKQQSIHNQQFQQQYQRMHQQQRAPVRIAPAPPAQPVAHRASQQPQPTVFQLPPGSSGVLYPTNVTPATGTGTTAPSVIQQQQLLLQQQHQQQQQQQQTVQQPILHLLRGLVEGPHEDSALGTARKDFESKLLMGVEICNHMIGKIYSLTNSNSFKNIRNLRDLKELFIHLSYLLTFGIGRFKTLQDRCVDDVKKMGFTKPSDFVVMGEKINNRNPEDDNSEDDDDCEIIEQNTTVIEVDSDEEAAAAGRTAAAAAAATVAVKKQTTGATVEKAPASPIPAANQVSAVPIEKSTDGSSMSLTVGQITVAWKVSPGAAGAEKEQPTGAGDASGATSGTTDPPEAAPEPAKDTPRTGGDDIVELIEMDENDCAEAEQDELLLNVEELMAKDDSAAEATVPPDDNASAKDEVELIEISDKEVSELLDIHATDNNDKLDDKTLKEKSKLQEKQDTGDDRKKDVASKSEDTNSSQKFASDASKASDTKNVAEQQENKGKEEETSVADKLSTQDEPPPQDKDNSLAESDVNNDSAVLDDVEQSSKGSSSEILNLMDAADDSYSSDSSDMQYGIDLQDALLKEAKANVAAAGGTDKASSVEKNQDDVQAAEPQDDQEMIDLTESDNADVSIAPKESNPSSAINGTVVVDIDDDTSSSNNVSNADAVEQSSSEPQTDVAADAEEKNSSTDELLATKEDVHTTEDNLHDLTTEDQVEESDRTKEDVDMAEDNLHDLTTEDQVEESDRAKEDVDMAEDNLHDLTTEDQAEESVRTKEDVDTAEDNLHDLTKEDQAEESDRTKEDVDTAEDNLHDLTKEDQAAESDRTKEDVDTAEDNLHDLTTEDQVEESDSGKPTESKSATDGSATDELRNEEQEVPTNSVSDTVADSSVEKHSTDTGEEEHKDTCTEEPSGQIQNEKTHLTDDSITTAEQTDTVAEASIALFSDEPCEDNMEITAELSEVAEETPLTKPTENDSQETSKAEAVEEESSADLKDKEKDTSTAEDSTEADTNDNRHQESPVEEKAEEMVTDEVPSEELTEEAASSGVSNVEPAAAGTAVSEEVSDKAIPLAEQNDAATHGESSNESPESTTSSPVETEPVTEHLTKPDTSNPSEQVASPSDTESPMEVDDAADVAVEDTAKCLDSEP